MTDKLKWKIMDIIRDSKERNQPSTEIVNKITEVVDKEVADAIMEGVTLGEMLKAVGLKIVSI